MLAWGMGWEGAEKICLDCCGFNFASMGMERSYNNWLGLVDLFGICRPGNFANRW